VERPKWENSGKKKKVPRVKKPGGKKLACGTEEKKGVKKGEKRTGGEAGTRGKRFEKKTETRKENAVPKRKVKIATEGHQEKGVTQGKIKKEKPFGGNSKRGVGKIEYQTTGLESRPISEKKKQKKKLRGERVRTGQGFQKSPGL